MYYICQTLLSSLEEGLGTRLVTHIMIAFTYWIFLIHMYEIIILL